MTRSNERASLAGILEGRRRVTTSSGRFFAWIARGDRVDSWSAGHTRRKAAGGDFCSFFFAWIACGEHVDSWSVGG